MAEDLLKILKKRGEEPNIFDVRTLPQGKVRRKAMKRVLESAVAVPAIRSPKTGKVTVGVPGNIHPDVIAKEVERRGLDPYSEASDVVWDEYAREPLYDREGRFKSKTTGFAHPMSGKYMSRAEASELLTGGKVEGESTQLSEALEKRPVRSRIAQTRRGVGQEAESLLKQRKGMNKALAFTNRAIQEAEHGRDIGKLRKLVNKRGLLRSIARKNRYFGAAMAAGDAIKQFYDRYEGVH